MQAVILAGGLGTRLRSVVSDRPKPMADVNGEPFLAYLLRDLKNAGVQNIIFAVGYMGEKIEEYFGNGSRWGLNIDYAYEKELLGTAGAIRNTRSCIREAEVLVMNGDTYYKMDYAKMFESARDGKNDMMIVLRAVPDVSRYGKVTLEDGRIVKFNEKDVTAGSEAGSGLINGGVYWMKTELIDAIPEGRVSLENTMIPKWLSEGRPISGCVHDGYFIDIGVPEDYYRFVEDSKEQKWTK
ncbi:MAG: nucleotidyltransferase family protein [Clostridiales bacterium]|nr:nucleotidyltransferase family protein [Clostridiales bacterium]